MMAGGTIDLDEIAMPEILDPRQVKGLHSSLCSWNVLRALRGLVNGDRDRMQPRKHATGAHQLRHPPEDCRGPFRSGLGPAHPQG
jgi:hypothetical protein